MLPTIIKWIIVAIATINFGYMIVDGVRALIVGDYFRPSSGQYAGQLGPWTSLVRPLGIDPEGPLMKSIFVLFGTVGLAITVAFARGSVGPAAMIGASLLSLWNLYMGTAMSVLQIILAVVLLLLL